jgi:hypothetical protein
VGGVKYVLDTEFVDSPEHSELISLAIVREDMVSWYFEFAVDDHKLTPWLRTHVVPHLYPRDLPPYTFEDARKDILKFIENDPRPEFFAYYGAYDWYWLCRVMGGFMRFPRHWPHRYREAADMVKSVPPLKDQPEHHALHDCFALLAELKRIGMIA